MELAHTHRTHQIRTDMELAALALMGRQEDKSIDEMEANYRGAPRFERVLKDTAAWLGEFANGFKAIPHECRGQLC